MQSYLASGFASVQQSHRHVKFENARSITFIESWPCLEVLILSYLTKNIRHRSGMFSAQVLIVRYVPRNTIYQVLKGDLFCLYFT